MEHAKKAIKELNGTWIRGKRMLVSFAKYDRNERPWSFEEEGKAKGLVRSEENYRKPTNEMRSFKEVILGVPTNQQREVWVRKRIRSARY